MRKTAAGRPPPDAPTAAPLTAGTPLSMEKGVRMETEAGRRRSTLEAAVPDGGTAEVTGLVEGAYGDFTGAAEGTCRQDWRSRSMGNAGVVRFPQLGSCTGQLVVVKNDGRSCALFNDGETCSAEVSADTCFGGEGGQ